MLKKIEILEDELELRQELLINSQIMEDEMNKNDWLYVLTLTNKLIKQCLNLLVIDIPSIM